MPKTLSVEDLFDRAEACNEAASHLENGHWADTDSEMLHGQKIAKDIRRMQQEYLKRAHRKQRGRRGGQPL